MPAAIRIATERICAKYNEGAVWRGGRKLLNRCEPDWSMFAYALPLWNSNENKTRLIERVMNDWVVCSSEQDNMTRKELPTM